jgi:hypothetical protein
MPEINIDQEECSQLSAWLMSKGEAGHCPDWYDTIIMARALNMSVMELEERMAVIMPGFQPADLKTWLIRATICMQAELSAQSTALALSGMLKRPEGQNSVAGGH